MDVHDDTTLSVGKACSKCGEVKPLEEFYRDSRKRDGRQSACRACSLVASASWKARNKERRRATNAAWEAANRDRRKAITASWYAANRERKRATGVAWRAANRERKRATDEAYRSNNLERVRAASRSWVAANAERAKANTARWAAAHPDKIVEKEARRRARKANAPVRENISRQRVWARDRGRCHICGKKCDPQKWDIEHIVPLSHGGEESMRNVAVAHPRCNYRKGTTGPGQQRLFGDV